MARELVVVGAGGFGREVIDVVRALNAAAPGSWDLVGVIDDDPSSVNRERLAALGLRLLGGLDALTVVSRDTSVAIGVGSPTARSAVADRLSEMGFSSPVLVHPTAVIGSAFRSAEGVVVCGGVSIGTNVELGRHVHLNPHAVIGHDAILREFVSVNPNATVSGDCHVERRVLVGAGAVVLQGLRVAPQVTIGAAACVVAESEQGETLVGVPARPLKRGTGS